MPSMSGLLKSMVFESYEQMGLVMGPAEEKTLADLVRYFDAVADSRYTEIELYFGDDGLHSSVRVGESRVPDGGTCLDWILSRYEEGPSSVDDVLDMILESVVEFFRNLEQAYIERWFIFITPFEVTINEEIYAVV